MREKLNENPMAQVALIGILVLVGGYLLLSHMGGGESAPESESGTPTSSVSATPEGGASAATSAAASGPVTVPAASPLPAAVKRAYAHGAAIALLVVRAGGIDDRLVERAASVVRGDPGVALFVVPAERVSRYAAITGPLGVESAPALIVVRPRRLNGGGPAQASVTYGFQSSSDVEQAVRDAFYKGPRLTYAPN